MSRNNYLTRDTTFKFERAEQSDDEMIIEGYFALYENETTLYPGCYEIISKGAFDNTLSNDVRALGNHDHGFVLGRTNNGTLSLQTDEKGLYGVIKINANDSEAVNLYERVKRGDVNQCSFGFNILDEQVEELANGEYRWRINDIDLHEVSIVTFPQYENTSVQARQKQVQDIKTRSLKQKKLEIRKKLEALYENNE